MYTFHVEQLNAVSSGNKRSSDTTSLVDSLQHQGFLVLLFLNFICQIFKTKFFFVASNIAIFLAFLVLKRFPLLL